MGIYRKKIFTGPVIISVIYFLFGFLWIFCSDRILLKLSPTHDFYTHFQTYKGWIYVLVTTLLIYSLLKVYSDRKQKIMLALNENRKRYQKLSELTSDITGAFTINNSYQVTPVWLAGAYEKLTGYTIHELMEKAGIYSCIHPDDQLDFKSLFESHAPSQRVYTREFRIITKSGQVRWLVDYGHFECIDEQVYFFYQAAQDITLRKQAEVEISNNLKEKEMMLKEIHHRVKNNLQVITSLLNLHNKGIDNATVRDSIQDVRNRIYSMALVHEQLYRSEMLANIEISQYIKTLAEHLHQLLIINDMNVEMEFHLEPARLSIDKAIPCGIILNELLTNVFKHAFTHTKAGRVDVGLASENGHYILTVSDNGAGFDASQTTDNDQNLGHRLVGILATQLDGSFSIESSPNGTESKLVFAR